MKSFKDCGASRLKPFWNFGRIDTSARIKAAITNRELSRSGIRCLFLDMALAGRKLGRWTQNEDDLLREVVMDCSEPTTFPINVLVILSDWPNRQDDEDISWHKVASRVPGRNNKDCRKRWVYTL